MKALKLAKSPYTSLAINFGYALGNCTVGFLPIPGGSLQWEHTMRF